VPEHLRNIPRGDALSKQERRGAMPQIMKAKTRNSGRLQDGVMPANHRARVERRSNRGSEHEPAFLPFVARRGSLFGL